MRREVRYSARAVVISCFVLIAIWVIISAQKWPVKTQLFPVAISGFVFVLAIAELFFTLFEKESGGKEMAVMDFKLSKDTDDATATRRTVSISLWILGFFFLILLLGFTITIPLYTFLYLKLAGRERWGISIGLAIGIWVVYYLLFIHLLQTPLIKGLIVDL